jgi:hypothetical protein
MKLIYKDALVTEIDRRIKVLQNNPYENHKTICHLDSLKQSINTLEVKEVDLDYIKNELDEVVRIYKPDGDFGWGTLYNVATHFFELGMSVSNKVKKGE